MIETIIEIILGKKKYRYPRDDYRRYSSDRLDESCAFFERCGCDSYNFYIAVDDYVETEGKIYEKLKADVEQYNNSKKELREKLISYFAEYINEKNKS